MLLQAVSNGMGGQSMYLLWLAAQRRIPATVSITADTGSENDCLWNTGRRSTAKEFFEEVISPFASAHGLKAYFFRAKDKDGKDLPPLRVWMEREIELAAKGERENKFGSMTVPMFGNEGGRLGQSCTDKWKVRAIRQQARALGATHLRSAQGIHFGEADRRVKGVYLRDEDGYSLYQDSIPQKNKPPRIVKWMTHYYPLVDLKMNRKQISAELKRLELPFVVGSQCDHCPHKDLARWQRTDPAILHQVAELESKYRGDFFLSRYLVPLPMAIERMQKEDEEKKSRPVQLSWFDDVDDADFGCGNSYCGV